MWNDVVDLQDFYVSHLGQVARHTIRRGLRTLWPDLHGQSLLGLGYATPYLRQFCGEAERIIACMPASQGVLHWPPEGPGVVALTDETDLPLPDYSVDRVLLVHALESTEQMRAMLDEVWRVMTSNGRLLVVVPNRRGIWARIDRTPFGWGHPYSRAQLSRVLRDHLFTPTRTERALYIPPTRSRTLLRSAIAWERLGQRLFPTFSGVIMAEAGKQIYAAGLAREKPRRRRSVVVPMPQVVRRQARDEGV
ncbi:MAG: class I SAM-dependent methyltransferase [Rhodospirillales bacterium]|nr:class I SAM-dependent methyltransferase [Rhodospirillales bacterium]